MAVLDFRIRSIPRTRRTTSGEHGPSRTDAGSAYRPVGLPPLPGGHRTPDL